MNKIFEPRGFFTVPDGTDVSPFMNATDAMQQDVPWGALGDMSIAAGRIGPGVSSWIHVHPIVTHVTYLVSGHLGIRMKEAKAPKPYDLELRVGAAVLTEPGTLFQLQNTSDEIAEVLYIVSPSYAFEVDDGKVVYNDAVLVAETWEDLRAAHYDLAAFRTLRDQATASRAEAMRRLPAQKGIFRRI